MSDFMHFLCVFATCGIPAIVFYLLALIWTEGEDFK